MKTKLTVTVDEALVPKAKRYARQRGMSLSQLIETSLRSATEGEETTFSQRWRGKFESANRSDERYKALARRYL